MRSWTKQTDGFTQIDVLLFDQFSNHCLANTIEPFRAANNLANRSLYEWRFLSLTGGEIISSSGLPVATVPIMQTRRNENIKADYLMVISSYGHRELVSPVLINSLKKQNAKTVIGLDTGAWLLAASGLLDGRIATIHGDVFQDFSETFLTVEARSERIVIDDDYLTCGGAMAAFDLVLSLIRDHHGEALAMDVSKLFLHENSGLPEDRFCTSERSTLVSNALQLMEDNLENPLTVPTIADELGSSEKQLLRRFRASLGASPQMVYRHLRLSFIRKLLTGSKLPIAEIALRGGYANASAMTRAFKQEFGYLPKSIRNR